MKLAFASLERIGWLVGCSLSAAVNITDFLVNLQTAKPPVTSANMHLELDQRASLISGAENTMMLYDNNATNTARLTLNEQDVTS